MPNDDLEVFHILFPRKNRMEVMVSHPGQEYCYVISGRIRFLVGTEVFELAPGEGIFLNSELPHRAENIGRDEARILMVVAKFPFKCQSISIGGECQRHRAPRGQAKPNQIREYFALASDGAPD